MIDLSSDIIDFEPIAHSYTNRRTRRRYLGITTFIGQLEPVFNMNLWTSYTAVKRFYGARHYKFTVFKGFLENKKGEPKKTEKEREEIIQRYYDRSPNREELLKLKEEIRLEWKEENRISLVKGSAYHAEQEDKTNFNKFRILKQELRRLADVSNIPRSHGNKVNLSQTLPDGIHPEVILSNHEYQLSGQADYVYIETINGIRYIDIDDYKTNKKLTKENKFQTFLTPLDFLEHHKMNIYRLQINLYAWLAEQHGFVVRDLTLTYAPDKNTVPVTYPIYRFFKEQDPIKLMLKVRKNQLK